MNRHIKESSCGTLRPQRSYPCRFCNFPFKRITHLNQHILRKHSNNPELELVFEKYRTDEPHMQNEKMVNQDELSFQKDYRCHKNNESETTKITIDKINNNNDNNNKEKEFISDPSKITSHNCLIIFLSHFKNSFSDDILCMQILEEEEIDDDYEDDDDIDELYDKNKWKLHCILCNNLSIIGLTEFVCHLKNYHLTEAGHYQCTQCRKQYKSRNTIRRHLKESGCLKFISTNNTLEYKIFDQTLKQIKHITKGYDDDIEVSQAEIDSINNDENIRDEENYGSDKEETINLSGDDDGEEIIAEANFKQNEVMLLTRTQSKLLTVSNETEQTLNNKSSSSLSLTPTEIICDKLKKNDTTCAIDHKCKWKWPKCNFMATTLKQLLEHKKLKHLGILFF